jgi:hypothetical protein
MIGEHHQSSGRRIFFLQSERDAHVSAVSLPVTRPAGRALVIGGESCRAEPAHLLRELGFQCGEADDPYAAMAELARRPRIYSAIVLSLTSLFREELALIATIKRRYPYMEVWLTHTDGRAAAMAEAISLGAAGLLDEKGLHRMMPAGAVTGAAVSVASSPALTAVSPISSPLFATPTSPPPDAGAGAGQPSEPPAAAAPETPNGYLDETTGEPVLTAEELRALLQDPPAAATTSGTE